MARKKGNNVIKITLIIIILTIFTHVLHYPIKAEDTTPPSSSTTSSTASSILEDASKLMDIYLKIRLLSGASKGSDLTPYLDQLNGVLDKVLAFKESFTPEKKEKVVKQLDHMKKETQKIAELEGARLKKNLGTLGGEILELVKILAE